MPDQLGIDEYFAPIPSWGFILPVVLFALGRLIQHGPRGFIPRRRPQGP